MVFLPGRPIKLRTIRIPLVNLLLAILFSEHMHSTFSLVVTSLLLLASAATVTTATTKSDPGPLKLPKP